MRELLEASQKDKKGVMLYMKGTTIGGAVVKIAGDEVELRSREYSRIIVKMAAIDASPSGLPPGASLRRVSGALQPRDAISLSGSRATTGRHLARKIGRWASVIAMMTFAWMSWCRTVISIPRTRTTRSIGSDCGR